MEQGERGDNLYIVDKGAAQIVRRKVRYHTCRTWQGTTRRFCSRMEVQQLISLLSWQGSSSFVVATLGPGSTFGEASVMFNR